MRKEIMKQRKIYRNRIYKNSPNHQKTMKPNYLGRIAAVLNRVLRRAETKEMRWRMRRCSVYKAVLANCSGEEMAVGVRFGEREERRSARKRKIVVEVVDNGISGENGWFYGGEW